MWTHQHWAGTGNLIACFSVPVGLATIFGDADSWMGLLMLIWLATAWCKDRAYYNLRRTAHT